VQVLPLTDDPYPLIEKAIEVNRGRGVIKIGDRRLGTTIAAKVDAYRAQA
jgi:hypothetical protein